MHLLEYKLSTYQSECRGPALGKFQLRSGQVHSREHSPPCVSSYNPEQSSYATPVLLST